MQSACFASVSDEELRRVFVYFPGDPISNTQFLVTADLYSLDNDCFHVEGSEVQSSGLTNKELGRKLWLFDVPQSASTSVFSIKSIESGADWVTTRNAQYIDGCVYQFNTRGYILQTNSTWTGITISTRQFADYFLSKIDVNSDSATNGYMIYKSLKKSVFDNLSDFSSETAASISWYDQSMRKITNVNEKWGLVKSLYESRKSFDPSLFFYAFLGMCLLVVVIVSAVYIKRCRKIL